MKRTYIIIALILSAFLFKACVEDEVYVDPNAKPDSESVLVINEVASNNGDPNPDWIEIYNPSSTENRQFYEHKFSISKLAYLAH